MKLGGIEATRGLAALFVVLRHATVIMTNPAEPDNIPFGGLFMFGRAGVEFFFVLSGFIMVYVHRDDLGKPAAFASFWQKRVLRIYPPYWVATAILGVILVFSPTHDRAEQSALHWLLSLLLMPEAHDPILDVGWSLRHEMLFYLLFSLMILHRPVGMAVMALWYAGIVASLAASVISGSVNSGSGLFGGQAGQLLFRGFNIEFFFGMAVALLVRRPPRYAVPMLALGAALFVANGLIESFGPPASEWPPRVLGYAIASSMMLYGVAQLDRARAWRIPAALLILGRASYSIYLVHVTILLVVAQLVRLAARYAPIPADLAFLVAIAVALGGGIVFSMLVERPVLRLGRPAARPA